MLNETKKAISDTEAIATHLDALSAAIYDEDEDIGEMFAKAAEYINLALSRKEELDEVEARANLPESLAARFPAMSAMFEKMAATVNAVEDEIPASEYYDDLKDVFDILQDALADAKELVDEYIALNAKSEQKPTKKNDANASEMPSVNVDQLISALKQFIS